MKINHKPCISDDEICWRMFQDQQEIRQMRNEGHAVTAMVMYHSESTLETHALPIFASDRMEDICNRYYDFFPKECIEVIDAIQARDVGMSKGKTLRATCSIPQGLWVMLKAWNPRFCDSQFHGNLIRQLLTIMPKLKATSPYGSSRIAVS